MKTLLLCLLVFLSIEGFSQWENQIPNYSFEKVNNNFPSPSESGDNNPDCGLFSGTSGQSWDYIQEYWENVIEWTHPLVRTPCIACPKVATADLRASIYNPPPLSSRSGLNWGFTKPGEYLVVPTFNFFDGGLDSSKKYYIEVFHKGTANKDLDVVGYVNQPKICGYQSKLLQNINANVGHSEVLFSFDASNSSEWWRYRGYFSPNGFKKWLSFGNSGEWDDLRIYEVENNKCRDDWYFDNTVFNYPFEIFQASKNIYVGNGVDPENGVNHIPGDVVQYANTEVILRAGNQVIIDQGTFANNAGPQSLIIENSPCGDNLCPDELEFENEVLCNQSSVVIGTEGNDWGTSVQWSPSTYLSDPNVANPTFTSPGGVGSITYEVEITYECDASEVFPNPDQPLSFSNSYSEIHEVVVQYTNSSDPSASITANVLQDDVYNFETDLTFSEGVTEIEIEVVSSSGPGFSQTYYLGEDFSCCNYNWELPNAWRWSSCDDDIIIITARNKCSGEESVIELPWDKSQIPFTGPSSYANVVTANNDGVNDQLCFNDIESADNYTIYILNRWGNTIYFEINEDVTDSRICIDASLENYTEGTYFYLVSFTDECGNSVVHDQDFFLVTSQKSNSSSGGRGEDVEYHTIREYLEENISISPNPTSSILNISGPSGISSVEIVDKTGRQIIKTEVKNSQVNVQNLESGTYYCKFSLNDILIIKKFVKI